jgi:16S rRNA (cytidine1402-2'-O)-methyltransferase
MDRVTGDQHPQPAGPHPNDPHPGTLYIVATPIGNLEDITLRALRILRGVTVIAAEDTRTTHVLLRAHDISTPCISCYSANERRRIPELIDRLQRGESVALVSDAGTPGVSDPAALVVAAAVAEDITVVPVPGASAALAALVASGLRIDRFHFEGFLPIKKRRQTRLRTLAAEARTIILYESVHRLVRTLADLEAHLGNRRIAVCRELTKKFEEIRRGSIADMRAHFAAHAPRGEFVLVVAGADDAEASEPADETEAGDTLGS